MSKIVIPYTYLIKHTKSGNLYHGSRSNKSGCHPEELLKENGYTTSSKIIKEIIKNEGLNSFEIIEITIHSSPKEAIIAEEQYHKLYDVAGNVYYFNQHNAGTKFTTINTTHNRKHREETKQKIGISNKGKCKGRSKSEETKQKMRKPKSEEHRKKMLGRKVSEDAKRKIGQSKKGIPRSEETKMKLSLANMGKKHTEETIDKMRVANLGENNGMFGKIHNEETRSKMSDSWKNRSTIECPHCHKVSKNASSMKRFHFDNCPKNENYIAEIIETIECNYCGKKGKDGLAMRGYHFDNCKLSPNYVPRKSKTYKKSTCPHCDKEGGESIMKRWHFDNCKHKVKDAA